MSKNKKSQTRIKKAFVFEGPVKSFNVMETLFPELWGKCSFRIRRVFASEGVTFVFVEAKDERNRRHTIILAVQDSVCMCDRIPKFKDAAIRSCENRVGNVALAITKQFIVFGHRILVIHAEGEIDRIHDHLEKIISSSSMP